MNETRAKKLEPVIKIPVIWIVIAFILMMLLGSCYRCSAAEQAITPSDVYRATCRVYAPQTQNSGSMGSGTVVGLFDGYYYILTNHHVTDKAKNVEIHFFGDGTKITKTKGEVVANFYDEKSLWDFARIRVKETDLADYDPPFVPLAPANTKPDTTKYLITSGCGSGRWASVFKGGVESYYGDTAMFFPAPVQGQSGSGIIQWYDGRPYLNAVLTYRCEVGNSEDTHRGGAIPITHYYDAVHNRRKSGVKDSIPPNSIQVACFNCRTCNRFGCASVSVSTGMGRVGQYVSNPIWDVVSPNPLYSGIYANDICFVDSKPSPIRDRLIVVEKDDCVNCDIANDTINDLIKSGYPIQVKSVNTDGRWISVVKKAKVSEYPVFLLVSETGDGVFRVKKSWGGCLNVRSRIISSINNVGYNADKTCDPASEVSINPCDPAELGPPPKVDVAEPIPDPCEPAEIIECISPDKARVEEKKNEGNPEDEDQSLPEYKECDDDHCVTKTDNIGEHFMIVPYITKTLYNVSDKGDKKDYIFAEPTYYTAQKSDPLTENYESGFFRQKKSEESENSGLLGNAVDSIEVRITKVIRALLIRLFIVALLALLGTAFVIVLIYKCYRYIINKAKEQKELYQELYQLKNNTKKGNS